MIMKGGVLVVKEGKEGVRPMKKSQTQIDELLERIEKLEISNDTTVYNFSLIREVIDIIKEIPAGKLILRRAENKQRLFNLKNNVLPRRQKQLVDIIEMTGVPKPIKDGFVEGELKLINSTTRAINHREQYEKRAHCTIHTILSKLNIFNNKKELSHARNQ